MRTGLRDSPFSSAAIYLRRDDGYFVLH